MARMYFGHPINTCNTRLEAELLAAIKRTFPSWDIEDPNQPHHQAGYQRWQAATGRPMDYFYHEVLPSCHGGVFIPFHDWAWGAGVFGEAKKIARQGGVLFSITPGGIIRPMRLTKQKILTVEQTRQRVKAPNGRTRPYFPEPARALYD